MSTKARETKKRIGECRWRDVRPSDPAATMCLVEDEGEETETPRVEGLTFSDLHQAEHGSQAYRSRRPRDTWRGQGPSGNGTCSVVEKGRPCMATMRTPSC